jgi:hypothetical protein
MRRNKFSPLVLSVFGVFIANLLFIDFWLIRALKAGNPKVLSAATSSSCPAACVDLIKAKTGWEQTVAISASGSTTVSTWTTITGSEITFNKASYSGAKKIYFQANLNSNASDLAVYARLYDATHGIGVQGSDISTKSTTATLVQSDAINPFSGDLSLKVQIKSLNGNLVTLSNPRIRVVY